MPSSAKVSDLIRVLYEAAADPRHWIDFLEAIIAQTSAACGFVIGLPEGKHPALYHQLGLDASALRSYDEHFFQQDLILDRFREAGNRQGSWIGTRQSILTGAGLEQSHESMPPIHHYHQAGVNIGPIAGYSFACITLFRPRSSGEFDAKTAALLRLLTPHIQQAILLHHRISHLHLDASLLSQSLETTGASCLTINAGGAIQNHTAAAETLLAQADGLTLSQNRLHALNPKEDRQLEAIIHEALTGSMTSQTQLTPAGQISISRTPPRKPLHLVITPFQSGTILGTHPCALVFLIDPESRTHPRGTLLRRLFALTPSEAKLGELLAEGLDVRCCAERMRITEASARFVLKRIFQKTSVRSQSALMRLTLSLPCLPSERISPR